MLTIDAQELAGLLTDLSRSVTNAEMPTMHGIQLYAAAHKGETVMVGRSTDRYMAAQAHATANGELAPLFLPMPSVKLLLPALKGVKVGDAQLTVDGGTLRVQHPAGVNVVPVEDDSRFVPSARFDTLLGGGAVAGVETVAFAESLLSTVAAVAKRRKGYMSFRFHGEGMKGAEVVVGDHYRAVIMPMRLAEGGYLTAPVLPRPAPASVVAA